MIRMKNILWLAILLIALPFANAVLPQAAQSEQSAIGDTVAVSYREVYSQLKNLEPDPAQAAEIRSPVIFRRDVGNFTLQKGILYLCKPVQGRICAAFFSGEGQFSFTPPTEVEKEQLYRFYKTNTLEEKFTALFLVFADSTREELGKQLAFAEGKIPGEVKDHLGYAVKYLQQERGKRFDYRVMKTMLDNQANGFFYSHFSRNKTEPLFFEINPFSDEEVRFMRRLKGPSFYYFPELINQFHLQSDYAAGIERVEEDKSNLKIRKYTIECKLEGSELKFSAATEIDFQALKGPQNWLFFFLFEELEMDSIFWGDGRRASFVKEKDSPFLWVKCVRPMPAGESARLKFYYRGKLIERQNDWFFIKSPRQWYPKDDANRGWAEFDVTYHYPKNFQFAAAGNRVFSETRNGMVVSRWVSPRSISDASFNIGFFEEHKIENDTIPPVTVYMAETGHRELAHQLAQQGIGSGTGMLQKVAKDVANSVQFFQNSFGAAPDTHFYATEIPYLHGEAYPGLITLTWQTFQLESDAGDNEIFRAHETAHQWWGIGVDFKTYHDQWLSEAFAEYCGWWYYHEVVKNRDKNEKKFYKMLENRRKEITGNRDFFFGKGKKAGPIWLGYRTLSSETPGDYTLVIYKKGAWLLHMLRSMYLDLNSMGDERFMALLEGFYRKYYRQKASTEDFQAFAEEFMGEDLDWFFKQWVYGTDVPEYKFAYTILPGEDGQFKALGRVSQAGVGEDFRMPVIVGVDFGGDEIAPERVLVRGPLTELELGPYPRKPEKLIFNHLESVLCEVKYEKWK